MRKQVEVMKFMSDFDKSGAPHLVHATFSFDANIHRTSMLSGYLDASTGSLSRYWGHDHFNGLL